MYTCCPQCSTTFRVGPAQLQVANGKVRCGQCHSVFSALAYLREDREEPRRPAASPSPSPQDPPSIIAQADAAGASQEGRYEEDLVDTDEWEILAQPTAPAPGFPAEFDSPPDQEATETDEPRDAAFEAVENTDVHLEHPGAANAHELSDDEFDSAAEEALLEAQLELDSSDAEVSCNATPASDGIAEDARSEAQLALEGADAGGLPDATFGLDEDEFPDSQLEDDVAAELAIEQALQAAMAEEGIEGDQPEIEVDIEHSLAEDIAETASYEATEPAPVEDIAEAASYEVAEDIADAARYEATEPVQAEIRDELADLGETSLDGAAPEPVEAEEELAVDTAAEHDEWELGLLEAYARDAEEPPLPPGPTPATEAAAPAQDIPDDDLDDFLFDDEHGIQEYLEQHSADAQGAQAEELEVSGGGHAESIAEPESAEPEPAEQEIAEPAPEESAPRAVMEPPMETAGQAPAKPSREDQTVAEPGPVEDLSVFDNFDLAVEAAADSSREDPSEPAAPRKRTQTRVQTQPSPQPDVDPAHSRAMMAQELSLLDRGPAETEKDSGAPGVEEAAPDDELLIFEDDKTPAEAERQSELTSALETGFNSSQAALQSGWDSESPLADDDPLARPGSEEYTFPLYFEQEKASQVMADADAAAPRGSDETELLVDNAAEASPDPDPTMMMRLPLGDSVEFEVPIDDEDDDTYLLDVGGDEVAFEEQAELWPELPTAKGLSKKASWRHRGRRIMWSTLSVLLLLALATQLVHYNRESLVIRPTIGPWLQDVYAGLGLKLAPPGDLDQYEIRLHVAPAIQGKIQISATLANLADHVQPYPLVRLVLEDRWQEAVGNLIVEPRDYLAQAATGELMAPRQRVEAQIEVVDPGPTAESYKLDVCLRHSQGTLRCADDS